MQGEREHIRNRCGLRDGLHSHPELLLHSRISAVRDAGPVRHVPLPEPARQCDRYRKWLRVCQPRVNLSRDDGGRLGLEVRLYSVVGLDHVEVRQFCSPINATTMDEVRPAMESRGANRKRWIVLAVVVAALAMVIVWEMQRSPDTARVASRDNVQPSVPRLNLRNAPEQAALPAPQANGGSNAVSTEAPKSYGE